jgi:beta-N-acetylhexosaminidase
VRARTLLCAAALMVGCGGGDEPVAQTASNADEPPPAQTVTATQPAETTASAPREPQYRLSPRQALGQMIVARYAGLTPPPTLLRRIGRGEVGGVILFADNVSSRGQVAASVRRLDRAARAGRHPKVLVMIDQEGGLVKRLPGPPTRAADAMTTAGVALREGRDTGRMLRRLGIDVNLAPVADVAGPGSFLGSRGFGTDPDTVGGLACAFARGLTSARVAATLKHFPGLGAATTNTDDRPTSIGLGRRALRRGYAAYRECGADRATLVMVASASYPRVLGNAPAVLTKATYEKELQAARVSTTPTISDDLETPAIAGRRTPARRAVNAGLDLLLYARTEAASAVAFTRLLADVRAKRIPEARVQEAAGRILKLKASLAAPAS